MARAFSQSDLLSASVGAGEGGGGLPVASMCSCRTASSTFHHSRKVWRRWKRFWGRLVGLVGL
eukprot:868382-Prorocentrum_minimum.AAC.1